MEEEVIYKRGKFKAVAFYVDMKDDEDDWSLVLIDVAVYEGKKELGVFGSQQEAVDFINSKFTPDCA